MAILLTRGEPANALAAFLRQRLGENGMARLKGRLSREENEILAGKSLASDRISVDVLNRLTRLTAEVLEQPVFEFGVSAGRHAAETATRTVYKFIIGLLSPASVFRAMPAMWNRVFNGGRVTVDFGDGQGTIRVDDIPVDRVFCGRLTGWFGFIGEKAAREVTTTHRPCRALGGEMCVWNFTWKV